MVLTTIRLNRDDVSPPVFLAGSFTKWQATLEMDYDTVDDGSGPQHSFYKVVDLAPGEHQYKYRLGPGDWWITDTSAATVADAAGNVNNAIQVEDEVKVQAVTENQEPTKPDSAEEPSFTPSDSSVASPSVAHSNDIEVADVQSLSSTTPFIKDSQVDGGEIASNGQSREPSTKKRTPSPVQKKSKPNVSSQINQEQDSDRNAGGFLRWLLCCCNKQMAVGVALVTVSAAVYWQRR